MITLLLNPYLSLLTIFILSLFVGYYVIWKVTPALHSPLMAVTNAISSIVIIGGLIAFGLSQSYTVTILSGFAIFLTAINIFGGFIVTWRMLKMYKR